MAGFLVALDSEPDIGVVHDCTQWSVTAFARRKIRHLMYVSALECHSPWWRPFISNFHCCQSNGFWLQVNWL